MAEPPARHRVLVLAPMPNELAPVVRRLKLARRPDRTRSGPVGRIDVTAALAGIGPEKARATTDQLIAAFRPDHVVVVGIAGGLGRNVSIGDLVVPVDVTDTASGRTFAASTLGSVPLEGHLITTAELIVDRAILESHADAGMCAVDMESAAIAEAAHASGLPWTAIRGISDHFRDGLIDGGTMGLLREDGSPDLGGVARYLARRPANVTRLAKLAKGTRAATTVATSALWQGLHSCP